MAITLSAAVYMPNAATIAGVFPRILKATVAGLTQSGDNNVLIGHGLTTPILDIPVVPTSFFAVWSDQGTWAIKSLSNTNGIVVTVAASGATGGSLFLIY